MENVKTEATKIREKYLEKEDSRLDKLKKLDSKVKLPATIFTYIFGIIGSLVFGIGMCLAMQVLAGPMVVGIIIGVVGIAMVSVNYPIYSKILAVSKKKYASQIIALSDELLNNDL